MEKITRGVIRNSLKKYNTYVYNGPEMVRSLNGETIDKTIDTTIFKCNIPEEKLHSLKNDNKNTSNNINVHSFYIYNRSDLVGKTLHDIDCPKLHLYDDFIEVGSEVENMDNKMIMESMGYIIIDKQ